jgi:hypothetical protein
MSDISFDDATAKYPFVMALFGLIVAGFKYTLASRSPEWDELYQTNVKAMQADKEKAKKEMISYATSALTQLLLAIGRCMPWYMKKESFNEKFLVKIACSMSQGNKMISCGDTSFEPLLSPLGLPKVTVVPKIRRGGVREAVQVSFFPHEAHESVGILKKQEAEFVADMMGSSAATAATAATAVRSMPLDVAIKDKFTGLILLHKSRRNACVMSSDTLADGLLAYLSRATLRETEKDFVFVFPCPCCEILQGQTLPQQTAAAAAGGGGGGGGAAGAGGGGGEESHRTLLVRGKVNSICLTAKQLNELYKTQGKGDCMATIKLGFAQAAGNTPNYHIFTCPNEACKMHTASVPFEVADSCTGCLASYKETHTGHLHGLKCHKCDTVGCALCGKDAASHVNGMCVSEEELAHRTLGQKKCPSCKAWTEKDRGCRHMHCRCGTDWCWEHEEAWDKGWQGMGHDRMHGSYACPGFEAQVAAAAAAGGGGVRVLGSGHIIKKI